MKQFYGRRSKFYPNREKFGFAISELIAFGKAFCSIANVDSIAECSQR